MFGSASGPGYFKDAIHDRVIGGNRGAVNPEQHGTKAAAHYVFQVPAGGEVTVNARLRGSGHDPGFDDFDAVLDSRRARRG